jgi:hypothetical protein
MHDLEQKRGFLRNGRRRGGLRATDVKNTVRDPKVREEFKRCFEDTLERYVRNPRDRQQIRDHRSRCDVDHKIDLQLGGQDIRSNLTFTNKTVNRSEGAQVGSQLRNVPNGTPIDFQ